MEGSGEEGAGFGWVVKVDADALRLPDRVRAPLVEGGSWGEGGAEPPVRAGIVMSVEGGDANGCEIFVPVGLAG